MILQDFAAYSQKSYYVYSVIGIYKSNATKPFCLDIGGSFKPGSFGKTSREKAIINAIAEKYGDMTEKGDPRFLEARMEPGKCLLPK